MKNLRINKRLAASLVSFTMITTSLVGCTNNNYEYETPENGTIECTGEIGYHVLKEYLVVELTVFDKKELYIVKYKASFYDNSLSYFDITNNKKIFDAGNEHENQNKSLESLGRVEDYLLYYDMVKDSYSVEDVEGLLAKIKEDKELGKNKTLTKDK